MPPVVLLGMAAQPTSNDSPLPFTNQLNLIPIGIGNKGDDGGAGIHRAGITQDLTALLAHLIRCGVDIIHLNGEVTEAAAGLIALYAPVIGEFQKTNGTPTTFPTPDSGGLALVTQPQVLLCTGFPEINC